MWNAHDWGNDKPYECGFETMKGEYVVHLQLVDCCLDYVSIATLIYEQYRCYFGYNFSILLQIKTLYL